MNGGKIRVRVCEPFELRVRLIKQPATIQGAGRSNTKGVMSQLQMS